MTKRFLITIGISGLISVIMGAFGSHLLNGRVTSAAMENWNMAVFYQMIHTVTLLAITFMNRYLKRSYLDIIYYFFLVGIILFSGSLYFSSLSDLGGVGLSVFKYLTPFGGLSLILGWVFVIISGLKYEHNKHRNRPEKLNLD